MVNISQSVWVVLSLGVVLIYLSLTTPTLNKKQRLADPMCSFLLGSGFSLVLYSVLCLVVQLS
jgi:hypothetical protein